eukprot:1150619-Pelagomonas_calceolata.AAC.5
MASICVKRSGLNHKQVRDALRQHSAGREDLKVYSSWGVWLHGKQLPYPVSVQTLPLVSTLKHAAIASPHVRPE